MILTSDSGCHNLTTASIPLVAIKHVDGCGWTQFTIDVSA